MLQTKYLSYRPFSFRKEDISKFKEKSFWLPMQPEFCIELITFERARNLGSKHPCEVSSKLVKWVRRRCRLKQLFKNDGRKMSTKSLKRARTFTASSFLRFLSYLMHRSNKCVTCQLSQSVKRGQTTEKSSL